MQQDQNTSPSNENAFNNFRDLILSSITTDNFTIDLELLNPSPNTAFSNIGNNFVS